MAKLIFKFSKLYISGIPGCKLKGFLASKNCTDFKKFIHFTGVDLEPDFLGVSTTPKLDNLGVCQNFWESAIFLKYNIIYS